MEQVNHHQCNRETLQARDERKHQSSVAALMPRSITADFSTACHGKAILVDRAKPPEPDVSTSQTFSFPQFKSSPLGPGAFFVSKNTVNISPIIQTPLIRVGTWGTTPQYKIEGQGVQLLGGDSTPPSVVSAKPTSSDSKLMCSGHTLTSMWIKNATSQVTTEPSAALKRLLDTINQPGQPTIISPSTLVSNAKDLAERGLPDESRSSLTFPTNEKESSTISLKSQREEAVKLYLISLDAILEGERPTASDSNDSIQVLLSSTPFHKSLMACALEICIASHDLLAFSEHHNFPVVMERLDLQPFDLSKVISHFVRHQPSLPRELQRHLFSIEERIVESLAWLPGSPLYPLIFRSSEQDSERPASKKMKLASSTTMPLSVGRPNAGPFSPSSQLSVTINRAIVQDFMRKALKLMSFRLALLVEALDFSSLFDQWTAYRYLVEILEHAAYDESHLFYNRHIDQIVLASLYGFCKVHKLDHISFRDIVNLYKKQPQSNPTTFRRVNLMGAGEHLALRGCPVEGEMSPPDNLTTGDIISFYNSHFISSMKSCLVNQATRIRAQQQQIAHSPPLDPSPTASQQCSVAQNKHQGDQMGKPPLPPGTRRRSSPPVPPPSLQLAADPMPMPAGLAALLSAALD